MLMWLFLTGVLIGQSVGLYEDQAGMFDWRQRYVGQITASLWDQSTVLGKRLIVASEQNVVASLLTKTGKIAWRQVFEQGKQGQINSVIHSENALITVTGNSFVRNWQPTSGYLQWEMPINGTGSSGQGVFVGPSQDLVAVTSGDTLYLLSAESGKEKWKKSLPNTDRYEYQHVFSSKSMIFVIGIDPSQQVSIVGYDSDGKLRIENRLSAPWIDNSSPCNIYGGHFVCIDAKSNTVYHTSLMDSKVFTSIPLKDFGFEPKNPRFVQISHEKDEAAFGIQVSESTSAVFTIGASGIKVIKDLPNVTAMQITVHPETKAKLLLTLGRNSEDKVSLRSFDFDSGNEVPELCHTFRLAAHHGKPKSINGLVMKRKDSSVGYRMIIMSDDHSVTLIQNAGRTVWVREEALASITNVEMVDLPVSEVQAKFEEEFGSSRDDIASMFIKRFKTQFLQLQTFTVQMLNVLRGTKQQSFLMEGHEEGDEEVELTRDNFNLNKIIVAATSAGKVFGIYSSSGKIVWRHLLPNIEPFSCFGKHKFSLLVQRTTAHFPNPPQCIIVGRDSKSGNGMLSVFNPITGVSIRGTPSEGLVLNYKIKQITLLPTMDEHFLKPILILDKDNKAHMFPQLNEKCLSELDNVLYMFTAGVDDAMLTGFQITYVKGNLKTQEVWNVQLFNENQRITNVSPKRALEHVHSQGLILADRSVLYKYLNPNLVVVTTEGIDSQEKPHLNVYLVDMVTGHIVFTCNHKRVFGPVDVVHSENWVIYSYYNEKNRRHEMSVVEMFQGSKQGNSTDFSSIHPPAQPIIMRQSYIFPFPLSTMTATLTEKGITDKHILIALKAGGIVEVQRLFLDARRPAIPRPEDREMGIIPYMPEIPLSFEQFVNYNQSVFNVRGIHTAPSGLESTSLIVAYGLDIFFTRVMPSKMFDVLKEDFDYFFIGCVLSAMILVSVVSKKLAERKALNRGWK